MFSDILVPGQNLYTILPRHVQIMSADGETIKKIKGTLLGMVPFQGAYISVADLQKKLLDNFHDWEQTVEMD